MHNNVYIFLYLYNVLVILFIFVWYLFLAYFLLYFGHFSISCKGNISYFHFFF